MFPAEVHAGGTYASGVEDANGVGPSGSDAAPLEVADGDAAVHALTASSKAVRVSAPAKRLAVLPR